MTFNIVVDTIDMFCQVGTVRETLATVFTNVRFVSGVYTLVLCQIVPVEITVHYTGVYTLVF